LVAAYNDGKFLADPEARGKAKANPMGSPEMMEGMMGMMKGNVAMMVPQTLIMGWINAFFAGFVLRKFFQFRVCLFVAWVVSSPPLVLVQRYCGESKGGGLGCACGMFAETNLWMLPF